MTKSLPFALLAGASLLCGATAFAATAPATTKTATKTVATKTVATKTTAAKPVVKTTTTHTVAHKARPAASGRMVTTKTSTGKTITYNCSKAGNANKAACKK